MMCKRFAVCALLAALGVAAGCASPSRRDPPYVAFKQELKALDDASARRVRQAYGNMLGALSPVQDLEDAIIERWERFAQDSARFEKETGLDHFP